MAHLTLDQQDYEALIALARKGATTQETQLALDTFLRKIESQNGITRYMLWVRWQEQNQPLPPTTRFPATWPPELQFLIELTTRPIAKADVNNVLLTQASKPMNVMVTKDPAALLGWTSIDSFFIT